MEVPVASDAVQSQTAVSAYFTGKQILPLGITGLRDMVRCQDGLKQHHGHIAPVDRSADNYHAVVTILVSTY